MSEDDLPTLYLNEKFDNLQADNLKCPVCGDKYMKHVPYVSVGCQKCGTKFTTDFSQDIYTKKARNINSVLAYYNGLIIKASEKFEGDVTHIKEHFTRFNNWDVGEIEHENEEHRRCSSCGMCKQCFTCKSCGKQFGRDENRRRQKCPHCNSKEFGYTYFKKCVAKGRINYCPYCNSDKVIMTRTKQKTKCHLCGSTKLSEPITERIFILIIKRKKAYRIEAH